MAEIITIQGKVKYPITLDPGVWIFDDRKIPLKQAFETQAKPSDEHAAERALSRQWERELQDRASIPSIQSEQLFVEKKQIQGDYVMPLNIFLANAEPETDAARVVIHHASRQQTIMSLKQAKDALLQFAQDGKPIRGEDGPVYLLYGDGSNRDNPIRGVFKLEIM